MIITATNGSFFTLKLLTAIDHLVDNVYVLLSACCHLRWQSVKKRGPRLTDDPQS